MTYKIERIKARRRWTLRLIGSLKSDDLEEIARELAFCGPGAALDLGEVTVVGFDVIRFLRDRERQGAELLRCPPYVRNWIAREKDD